MKFSVLSAIFATLLVVNSFFSAPSEQPSKEDSLSHRLDGLELQLKATQCMQDVEIIDISLSGFSNKSDYLKFKKNEILKQIKDKICSIDLKVAPLLDTFPSVANVFLTVVAMKSNWSVSRLLIQDFVILIEIYISQIPNYCSYERKLVLNTLPLILLDCGHNICVKCLILLASKSISFQINTIRCVYCTRNSYFDIKAYCNLFDDSPNDTIDMLSKIQRKGLLYSSEQYLFKKCPKKSCESVMKFLPPYNIHRNLPAASTCANGHSFCLNCNSSSQGHDFMCSNFIKMFVFGKYLYFLEEFSTKITKTQTVCKKCDRLMFKINSCEIDFEKVRDFLGNGSFFFCIYCSHLQVEDFDKNLSGFFYALSLEDKLSGARFPELNMHIKLLKEHYFLLISVVLIYYPFVVKQTRVKTFSSDSLNNFIIFYDRYLRIYSKFIEEYSRNPTFLNLTPVRQLFMDLSDLLEIVRSKTNFENSDLLLQKELIDEFDFSTNKAILFQKEFTQDQLSILLRNIFETKLNGAYLSQISDVVKNVEYPVGDQIIPIVEQAKSFLMAEQDLRKAIEDILDRHLDDFDYHCMVYSSQINGLFVLKNTEIDCRDFLSACKIPIPKTCAVCFKRYKEPTHVLPDCLHDPACKECVINHFKLCIEERNWDADGFILCINKNCSGIFQPGVVLEYLSQDHTASKECYENVLLNFFFREYSKNENIIECSNCGKFLQLKIGSRDMHNLSGEKKSIQEYDSHLKTVQCLNCCQ